MIKTVTFPERYDLMLEKESQRRFPHRTIDPRGDQYSREKEPYELFDLFSKGLSIEFKEGVNIIVGENGSGKTTLISLIKNYVGTPYKGMFSITNDYEDEEDYYLRYQDKDNRSIKVEVDERRATYKNTIFFNGEEDNPVIAIPKMINPFNKNSNSLVAQLFWANEESHGESMLPAIDYILTEAKGGYVIFMDEPETALSLKNQIRLANQIRQSAEKFGNQLIISTHSLAVINEFNTIFDMETRKWVNREDYVKEIYK